MMSSGRAVFRSEGLSDYSRQRRAALRFVSADTDKGYPDSPSDANEARATAATAALGTASALAAMAAVTATATAAGTAVVSETPTATQAAGSQTTPTSMLLTTTRTSPTTAPQTGSDEMEVAMLAMARTGVEETDEAQKGRDVLVVPFEDVFQYVRVPKELGLGRYARREESEQFEHLIQTPYGPRSLFQTIQMSLQKSYPSEFSSVRP